MKKVVTIGGATQDIFVYYEASEAQQLHSADNQSYLLLEEGTKIEVERFRYASGGGATNSAVGLKQLGFNTSIICKLAPDDAGEFILKELTSFGINTQTIASAQSGQTGTSFILPTPTGNRIIFVHRGANKALNKQDLSVLHLYDGVYITSLPGEASHILPEIAKDAQINGALVANNPGKGQLMGDTKALEIALKNIDIFILNAYEARLFLSTLSKNAECADRLLEQKKYHETQSCPDLLTNLVTVQNNCLNVRHFFAEILRRGPKIVIVTNGSEGVYAATKENLYFHKAIPTNMINSVGAGDSFGSCFFGSILQGYTLETALAFGALNSSSVLSTSNAKAGLLSFAELEKRKKALSKTFLQVFEW